MTYKVITEDEYECASHTLSFYNKNPHQKLCMDDAEKASFSKALWIVKEYHRQQKLKAINDEVNKYTK